MGAVVPNSKTIQNNMVQLTKDGNSIKFTFTDSQHYLYGNGEIECPVNSLILVTDESQMAVFKKTNGDIFISATYSELGMGKDDLVAWYKANAVSSGGGGSSSGGGITSGEVQSMINSSISGKADSTDVTQEINAAVSGKAETSSVTTVESSLTAHTANTDIHTTAEEKSAWNAKSDFSGSYNDLTDKPTIPTVPTSNSAFTNDEGYITESALEGYAMTSAVSNSISSATEDMATKTWVGEQNYITGVDLSNYATNDDVTAAVSGKADTSAVTAVSSALNNKQDTLVSGTNIKTINNTSILGEGNITIEGGGGIDSGTVQTMIDESISGKVDTTTFNTYSGAVDTALGGKQATLVSGTNIKTINNTSILGEGNITISGGSGGSNAVEVTQAEYDALVSAGTVQVDTFYIITDALPINLSGYAQTSAVTAEITAAVSGKTDTSAFTAHTSDTDIHTTAQEKSTWSGKQDALVSGTNIKTINNESILGSGNITIQGGGSGIDSGTVQTMIDESISGKADTTAVTQDITAAVTGKVDTSSVVTSVTSASTDSQIPTAKAVYDAIPTGSTGGGATYSAGTNISIDTANTISCTLNIKNGTASQGGSIILEPSWHNNTVASGYSSIAMGINCVAGGITSLALGNQSKTYGSYSVSIGDGSSVSGDSSLSLGQSCVAKGNSSIAAGRTTTTNAPFSQAFGEYTKTNNWDELSCGKYNNSVSGSTNNYNAPDNTIFSVGNGTADNARHNAFEVKRNGDIYLNDGTSDVKLQDYLQVKVVKISQSDYDALVQGGTVDSNTLYIIQQTA